MRGNTVGGWESNKDWMLGKWWCRALEEKVITNLEDWNFTQNQRRPEQKIENSDNDSGVADNGSTSIYLLPMEPN